MIIIKIQGGLGNQLLQYSIGQVIATNYNKEVAYDLSFFDTNNKYTKRPYLLDFFNITVPKATPDQIEKSKHPYGALSKIYNLSKRILNKYFFKKYYIGYDDTFLPLTMKSEYLYLEGFWQGYKYYEKNLPQLDHLICLKDMSPIDNFKKAISFNEETSVSVHIRRGDFLKKNAGTKAVPKEYYTRAVPMLEKRIPNPTYYVFSDDIDWVKEEMGDLFKEDVNAVFVSSYQLPDYQELMIIKCCKHAILSNSTFCWYPTLLTNTDEKVVIYPMNWENEYLNKDSEICPPTWEAA